MSGLAWVGGRGLALKEGRDRPVPPTVDGLVVFDCGYPPSEDADSRSALKTAESTDRMEPSGRSVAGKGGEETNNDAICISAVSLSGEPITAFWAIEVP